MDYIEIFTIGLFTTILLSCLAIIVYIAIASSTWFYILSFLVISFIVGLIVQKIMEM